jgi:peroxiredoxin
MNKTRLFGALFVALALTVAGSLAVRAAQEDPPAVSAAAPAFALKCTGGGTHSLDEFKGKIVVLEWTNPGCPVVVRHYKDGLMQAAQAAAKEKGVVWMAVNSTNPNHNNYMEPEALRGIYSEWKAAYARQLMDADGKTGKAYGAKTTPHMFVIDAEGKVVYNGAIDDDTSGKNPERINYVLAAIDELLAGKPVSVSTTKPYGCSVKYE